MSFASHWKWLVLLCALSACSGPGLSNSAALSESHVDEQGGHLSSAMGHLQEAHDRLALESDPHLAGQELEAGRASVGLAQGDNQKISQDIRDLAQSEAVAQQKAESLQREIDSHRNDLLGPRVSS